MAASLRTQIEAIESVIRTQVLSFTDVSGTISDREERRLTRALIDASNTLRGLGGCGKAQPLNARCAKYAPKLTTA